MQLQKDTQTAPAPVAFKFYRNWLSTAQRNLIFILRRSTWSSMCQWCSYLDTSIIMELIRQLAGESICLRLERKGPDSEPCTKILTRMIILNVFKINIIKSFLIEIQPRLSHSFKNLIFKMTTFRSYVCCKSWSILRMRGSTWIQKLYQESPGPM